MNKGYLRFTNERNSVLQKILKRMHTEITYKTDMAFIEVQNNIVKYFSQVNDSTRFTSKGRSIINFLGHTVDLAFDNASRDIANTISKYSKVSHKLTYLGEMEALARLTNKKLTSHPAELEINQEEIYERVRLSFKDIQNKLFSELDKAYVRGSDTQYMLSKFKSFLPEKRTIRQELKPIKQNYFNEAAKGPTPSMTVDFISDSEWNEILATYKEDFIPDYRYAKDARGHLYKYDDQYAWQVEQQANYEYLQSFGKGTEEAAKDGGASDLMWVAVMDDRTRDEHAMRDGLTSKEIQEKLDDEWSDEEEYPDRAIIPPSGFGCRCRAIPFFPEGDFKDDETLFQAGDFEKWLNE